MFQVGIGRKLGVGATRLKDSRSGEDIEQIAPLVVGGGTDPRAVLAGTLPVALTIAGVEQFPAMRHQHLFPGDLPVIAVSGTSTAAMVARPRAH